MRPKVHELCPFSRHLAVVILEESVCLQNIVYFVVLQSTCATDVQCQIDPIQGAVCTLFLLTPELHFMDKEG
jgi:hypothetical protein